MIKKSFIIAIILTFSLLTISFLASDKEEGSSEAGAGFEGKEKIRIAACTTCYFSVMERVGEADGYEIIRTGSTGESIRLFLQGEADMVLAGRTLRPEEPDLDHFVIEEGYSFLNDSGLLVYKDELESRKIFTDLDTQRLKSDLSLEEVVKVDDVYEYLDKGVVVTSWENTDYSQAEIVHVHKRDGQRLGLSRRPTLYCPDSCEKEEAKKFISILENN